MLPLPRHEFNASSEVSKVGTPRLCPPNNIFITQLLPPAPWSSSTQESSLEITLSNAIQLIFIYHQARPTVFTELSSATSARPSLSARPARARSVSKHIPCAQPTLKKSKLNIPWPHIPSQVSTSYTPDHHPPTDPQALSDHGPPNSDSAISRLWYATTSRHHHVEPASSAQHMPSARD